MPELRAAKQTMQIGAHVAIFEDGVNPLKRK